MKEIIITKYEAFDGKTFFNKEKCEEYEEKIKMDRKTKRANFEKLKSMMVTKVKEIVENVCPITETDMGDAWNFTWFKIENQEQLDFLKQFVGYDYKDYNNNIEKFPTYVCVETDVYDKGYFMETEEEIEGSYMYTFDSCISETKEFFNRFGYKVTIEKED